MDLSCIALRHSMGSVGVLVRIVLVAWSRGKGIGLDGISFGS